MSSQGLILIRWGVMVLKMMTSLMMVMVLLYTIELHCMFMFVNL